MAELPSASVAIDDTLVAGAAGTGYLAIFACVSTNDDGIPRVYGSSKGILDTHKYSRGASLAAHFIRDTRKPVVFVPLPIDTAGDVDDLDVTDVSGTSVITVTAGDDGIAEEADAIITVTTGGTIGAAGIEFTYSMNGGRDAKLVRLGTATNYTIPHFGAKLNFAAGTLIAGDVATFKLTPPMWAAADLADARAVLAEQQNLIRSAIFAEDCDETDAGDVLTQMNAYETENERFTGARVSTIDIDPGTQTIAQWITANAGLYAAISGRRINLGAGRLWGRCPITGFMMRRPVQWAAVCRQYQHDVQIPTWRKDDGPLSGWSLIDPLTGQKSEFDERVDAGALAARFTCARTWANGPNGPFLALDLTRADDGSLLSREHNMAVANLACTTVHAATENAIGRVLILKANGTATEESLQALEAEVNASIAIVLLQARLEGPRASYAVWRASRTDVLNVPSPTLTGVLDLRFGAALEHIDTTVAVQAGG